MKHKPLNVAAQFDEGDYVRITCDPHAPGHTTGWIMEVNGNAYGILFDGQESDGVYHWYVDNELQMVHDSKGTATETPAPTYASNSKKGAGVGKKNPPRKRLTNRSWFTIKNLAGVTDVSIYDEIGVFGVTAQDFLNDLTGVRGPINLRLNSGGGEVFDGIAIYHSLKQRGNVSVTIDGVAASIASVIAMAADPGKLSISKRASMMIHDGFAQAVGNAAEMRSMADLLEQQSDNIAGIYADRTGKTADYWRAQMRTETWYVGQQAVDAGLADMVVDLGAAAAAPAATMAASQRPAARAVVVVNANGQHAPMTGTHTHSHPSYASDGSLHSHEHSHDGDAQHGHSHDGANSTPHTPAASAKGKAGKACPACSTASTPLAMFCGHCGVRLLAEADDSGWVQDPDGKWRFDPDGDGDDDSTPEGDDDHDYFDEDGKQIKPIPPRPGAARDAIRQHLLNADVDNSAWDAAKAWHNGASSDDPAAFYKGICAGRRSGDPSKQSSWALPYKYHPGDAPNAAAVRNALARLSSTQGLTNESEAKSKLESLMKKINPDYEPSNLDTRLLQSALAAGLEPRTTTALEGSTR